MVFFFSKNLGFFRFFRFYLVCFVTVYFGCFASIPKQRVESFDVSIEPKQTEYQPKQFEREHIWVSSCHAMAHTPYTFLPAGVVCNALSCKALAGLLQALADESVLWHNTAALTQWRIPGQEKGTKRTNSLMQIPISTVSVSVSVGVYCVLCTVCL